MDEAIPLRPRLSLEALREKLLGLRDAAIVFFDRAEQSYSKIAKAPWLQPEIWAGLSDELKQQANELRAKLRPTVTSIATSLQGSLLVSQTDLQELRRHGKVMDAALRFHGFREWDAGVLHDEDRVLGVSQAGQEEYQLSQVSEARSLFLEAHRAIDETMDYGAFQNKDLAAEGNPQSVGSVKAISKEGGDKSHRVWVVHGRDERLRQGIFSFLHSIGLQPMEFSEARKRTGKPMPYVGEILEAAFQHAQAVVVLLTPDDEARLRSDLRKPSDPGYESVLSGQARANVLFEAGMALVSHSDRTILVQAGDVRPFSDVAGRHIVQMDGSTQKRQDLANRLEDAGCPVNLKGTDWHTAGDLTPPPKIGSSASPDKSEQEREVGDKWVNLGYEEKIGISSVLVRSCGNKAMSYAGRVQTARPKKLI